jgi:hypothetical protein
VKILVVSWCWCILSFTPAKEYNKLRGKCDYIGGQLVLVTHAKEYYKLRGKCDDTGLVLVHSLICTKIAHAKE